MSVKRRVSIVCAGIVAVGCGSSGSPTPKTEVNELRDGSAAGGASTGSGGTSASGGASSSGGTSAASGGSAATGGTGTTTTIPVSGDIPKACTTPRPTSGTVDAVYGKAVGTPGVWQDVTPSGVNLAKSLSDNYGAQDVLVDPVRPSDFYAFVTHQGVWKSTDYGATWVKVNTGAGGDQIDKGKPWGAGIDSSWCRDPSKPPALYTLNGAAEQGFWRSLDGGVSWTEFKLPANSGYSYPQDAYSIAVDPNDGAHLVVGFHEEPGLAESVDAGTNWKTLTPGGDSQSTYAFFIDTGDAATTRLTWLTIGQTGTAQRTTNGGKSWTQVNTFQHPHGCAQIFQAGGGMLYTGAISGADGNGIYRSTDYGVTWKNVSSGPENDVVGTATTMYATYAWANADGVDPAMKTSPRADGVNWTSVATPPAMTNGFMGAAESFDGTHHVIVSGNWLAGFWRYIEP